MDTGEIPCPLYFVLSCLPFDLNCFMLEAQNNPTSTLITSKTRNLLRLLEDFHMQNTITEPTRITYTTKSLIDLILTTKVDVVQGTGVMPLAISDHCLVYAMLKLGSKRPLPKIISTRNFDAAILRLTLKGFLFIS